jgi:predicted lipase
MSSIDMTPADSLNDQIVYTMLNKVKHSGENPHDVSFSAEDFEGETVSRELLTEQLQQIIPKYLLGEIGIAGSNSGNALATCKNAQVTTDGLAMLKAKFFKVDQT